MIRAAILYVFEFTMPLLASLVIGGVLPYTFFSLLDSYIGTLQAYLPVIAAVLAIVLGIVFAYYATKVRRSNRNLREQQLRAAIVGQEADLFRRFDSDFKAILEERV
jgi:membrane protein implicated in regulation of membrane protease activity